LEASSGIAGFVKAVMVLKKGKIPPQPNFVSEKHGLKLEERGIKVSNKASYNTPRVERIHD
jgi:acyl transferase domain-containing protein